MMAFEKLPRELLQEIISYLPNKGTNRKDLLNCSHACRSLWDAATPVIYRDIDLGFDENHDEYVEKTEERQLLLIKALAE